MAWTVKAGAHSTRAITDADDRTWVPVAWVAQVTGRSIQVDARAAVIRLVEPPPAPQLPAEPVGASVAPWLPVDAPIRSLPGQRSAVLLDAAIRQFRVAANPRYRANQQGAGETYCNIYAWDVSRALGAEVPHWVEAPTGIPVLPGRGRELDANGVINWLRERGPGYGWRQVARELALAAAEAGQPAVVCWFASSPPYIGHVAILRPAPADPDRGAAIAQAGAINSDVIDLADGFGDRRPLLWFVHD